MKNTLTLLTALLLAPVAALHAADKESNFTRDVLIPNPGAEAQDDARTWQGVPGIERAPNGRLWATWYTGGLHEGAAGNYLAIATSGDDGKTWSKPVLLIKGRTEQMMLADPLPWIDPKGRLWIFYLHASRQKGADEFFGTCAVRNDSPNDADAAWTQPAPVQPGGRIFGKPITLASGGWLAPFFKNTRNPEDRETCTLISTDEGATWRFHGGTSVPQEIRNFSEATLRKNGDLWMVMRTLLGLHHSTSNDGGRTWSEPVLLREGPNTRACMKRLASGAFLLVYHDVERPKPGAKFPRARIAAWLSDDEGLSWPHQLVVDDQKGVSYPDCIQSPDGRLYIAYDQSRYGPEVKDILLSVIREEDIRAGKIVSADARIHQLINRATGIGNIKEVTGVDETKMREEENKKLMEEGTK